MAGKLLTDITAADIRAAKLRMAQAGGKLRFRLEGMEAYARIRSAEQFVGLLRMLRENPHFHAAVVEVEKLQHEIRAKRGVGLPVPEEVWQKPDPAIVICWGGASVIAFDGGIGSLVGGAGGRPTKGITDALLDALALKVRLQASVLAAH